jgi:calcium-dependent protein kinase
MMPGVNKESLIIQHPFADIVGRYFETVRQIGKGTFGTVTLVRDLKTGYDRVSKEIPFGEGICDKPKRLLELTRQEIRLLADLDHPLIVKLHEYSEDLQAQRSVLILEHIDGGDCCSLLAKASQGLKEPLVSSIMQQTFVALAYCHGKGVLHRDIKAANILLKKSLQFGCPMCILVDFGLAAHQPEAGESVSTTGEHVGTPSYFAPEVVAYKRYTAKSDVWAVGVLGIELLTGRLAFGGAREHQGDVRLLFRAISNFSSLADFDQRLSNLQTWKSRSSEISRFLTRLLVTAAVERPSASEAVMDPWCLAYASTPIVLTSQIVQSLANYVDAPPPVRCCLLAIAVRTNVPEQHRLGSAFLAADVDGDGKISQMDLSTAVEHASRWWDPELDTQALIDVADFDHSGGLNYSEFVAACLYDRLGSLEVLANHAFIALDADRDDKIDVQEVAKLFPELDYYVLNKFAQQRFINRGEWCRTMVSVCNLLGGSSPGTTKGVAISCGGDALQCSEPLDLVTQCGGHELSGPGLQGCEGLGRDSSESDSEANAPPKPSRRVKKGTAAACWGCSCASDD